ncbi:UV radiation resistance-associated gene protein [Polyodon spathula]|nr:UV radiation resistance-associated gene protein [Polyodon spathula]
MVCRAKGGKRFPVLLCNKPQLYHYLHPPFFFSRVVLLDFQLGNLPSSYALTSAACETDCLTEVGFGFQNRTNPRPSSPISLSACRSVLQVDDFFKCFFCVCFVAQRRLRHLRSIAARNIVNRNGSPLLDTLFTLHLCAGSRIFRAFYKSEVVRDSLNPTWRSVDFAELPEELDMSVSCFVVRIWGGRLEQYQLLIEWKVNLDGLRYTGQQIRSRNPNEIIFGLNDGYYGASFYHRDPSEGKSSLLQVDQSSVRNSYSVFSLLRLHTAQRAIKQTQATVQKIGTEIEEKLRLTASSNELKKERECIQLKILVLRSELERQKRALGRELETLQKEQTLLQRKGEAFSNKQQSLETDQESLTEQQKECTAKRELFLKSNAQLAFRCRQLLSELSYIYPIEVSNQTDYVICGVKLPNSEDFQARDDGSVAVALGYTAHIVLMVSCFLQVPLRYPVVHKGSRSSIKDNITDQLSEKERECKTSAPKINICILNYSVLQSLQSACYATTVLHMFYFITFILFFLFFLFPPSDRHQMSSAIPVPLKSRMSTSEMGYPTRTTSPERGLRKRAVSETDQPQYRTPPPSYNTATTQPIALLAPPRGSSAAKPMSSSLDAAIDFSKSMEAGKALNDSGGGVSDSMRDTSDQLDSSPQRSGTLNGSAVPSEDNSLTFSGELRCSVEQAEEIMGTEATGYSVGGEHSLEGFTCIPVDHAVAVECDEQVLGELDVTGFEEFSRRIYALNENMSSFRRPRKNLEK